MPLDKMKNDENVPHQPCSFHAVTVSHVHSLNCMQIIFTWILVLPTEEASFKTQKVEHSLSLKIKHPHVHEDTI